MVIRLSTYIVGVPYMWPIQLAPNVLLLFKKHFVLYLVAPGLTCGMGDTIP